MANEMVGEVVVAKVNAGYLAAQLASLKVKTKGKDPKVLIEALQKKYKEIGADNKPLVPKFAVCDATKGGCGGKSDPNLDFCPFCGLGEEGFDPTINETKAEEPKPNGKSNGASNGASTQASEAASDDDAAPNDEEATMETTHATTNGVVDKKALKQAAKDAKAAEAKKKEDDKKAAAEVKALSEKTAAEKVENDKKMAQESTALVLRESNGKLDIVVQRVKLLMADGARSYVRIGQALAEAHAAEVWKLRSTTEGKPAYKSFDQLCEVEFQMPSDKAYNMIAASKKFTEEQIARLGESKAELLLKAPEKAQAKLIEKVEAGATYRETREAVKEARTKAGASSRNANSRTGAATAASLAGAKKRAEANESKITIATTEGTKTVKLYCKEGDEKPAKRLADAPWGQQDMDNGVIVQYALVTLADGQLGLKVRVRREKKS